MFDFSILISNPLINVAVVSWCAAQILKTSIHLFKHGEFKKERLSGAGGMPSSHSSLVMAVTTAIGLGQGFDSYMFGLALTVALVVMYDAAGVRRAAGDQARILNRVVGFIFHEEEFNHKQLKELLGHKPIEVLAGAILGVATAVAFYLA